MTRGRWDNCIIGASVRHGQRAERQHRIPSVLVFTLLHIAVHVAPPADKGGQRPPASTPGGALPVEGHHLGLVQVPTPCTCIGCPTVHACCEVDEVDQRSRISRLPQLADRLTAGNWRFPSSRPSCDQVMAWFTTPRCLPFRPRFLDTFPHPTSP